MSEIVNTNNFFYESYLTNYNEFVAQLKVIFSGEETQSILTELSNLSDNQKVAKGFAYAESISDEQFNDFTKGKIKVFSHKSPETQAISESLFGINFPLKNLLNNQPEPVKTIIWEHLHKIYLTLEHLKPEADRNKSRVKVLTEIVYGKQQSTWADNNCEQTKDNQESKFNEASFGAKSKLKDMLGVEVNDDTTGMIDDIVSSFEGILTGNSANPFAGIMEVSQKISVKYAEKINSGEIELDKLMKSISKKVPGMETMMSGMMGGSKEAAKPKEKIIIDENFSTASVAVGINKPEEKPGINIGSVLKMADQFGVIPGGKQATSSASGMPDLSALAGLAGGTGMPDMANFGRVMEIMQKLEKTETAEEAEALKQEMDSFLQKELGVNVDKLNQDLEQVQNQMNNSNSN